MMIAAIIPVLLFAGWIVFRSAAQGREDARVAASATVERVAERVRAEMMAQIQVAQALALSASLDAPDLATFYQEAERLKEARQLWFTVELDSLDGLQMVNLLRPLGSALGPTADRDSFAKAVRERRPVVGGIGPVGPVSGKQLVTVRVPVERAGSLRHILTIAFDPSAISAILRDAGTPERWIGAVVDQTGNIIARTVAEGETLGRPASTDLREVISRVERGRYTSRSLEGLELEVVFQSVPGIGGWSVHLGAPSSQLEAPVRRSLFALGGGIAASLTLGVGLTILLYREISRQEELEKRQAAAALSASERQGALAVQATDLGTWRWDAASDRFTGSERTRELLRLPPEREPGAGWPPGDFWSSVSDQEAEQIIDVVGAAKNRQEGFEIDAKLIPAGPDVSHVRIRGRTLGPRTDAVIGVLLDVTFEKQAEAERLQLLQRLAEAQELTQARIARELHDQVGQTVTGLALGLKSMERSLDTRSSSSEEGSDSLQIREKLRWLQSLTNAIGRDIHRAASDLRPTALDDLGLDKALRAHIGEWSRRFGVATDFQSVGLEEGRLPSEIETALYRATQEALTNVIKHAEARHVSLVLERRSREVRLVIEDDGVGFDMPGGELASSGRLGLSGMRERLAMIGGSLRVEAGTGLGTSLFIRVPLGRDKATF